MLVSHMNHSGLEGRCEFSRNSANEFGGAIFIQRSSVRHTAGRLTFDGNYAGPSPEYNVSNCLDGSGGAIAITTESTWYSSSSVSFLPTMHILEVQSIHQIVSSKLEKITTFFSNRAVTGTKNVDFPSLIFSQRTTGSGGALLSSHSLLTLSGSTHFFSNTTETYGGAIYIQDSELNVTGSITVSHNSVSHNILTLHLSLENKYVGGGLYAVESSIRFCGFSTFRRNYAFYSSGAIYINGGILQFNKSSTFDHNLSGTGGAIYASYTSVWFEDTFLTRNYAFINGDGINVQRCSL